MHPNAKYVNSLFFAVVTQNLCWSKTTKNFNLRTNLDWIVTATTKVDSVKKVFPRSVNEMRLTESSNSAKIAAIKLSEYFFDF